MPSRYAAALNGLGIFTQREVVALLKEYSLHGGDRAIPRLHPQTPQGLVAPWLLQSIAAQGGYNCLSGEERKAFHRAHKKAREYLPQLWTEVSQDETLLRTLSVAERVMLYLLYDIPEERLGIYRRN